MPQQFCLSDRLTRIRVNTAEQIELVFKTKAVLS